MALLPDEFPFNRPKPAEAAPVREAEEVPEAPTESAAPAPASLHLPPHAERRRARREEFHSPAVLRFDDAKGPPVHVELSNISTLGLRFHTNGPVPTGGKAQIRVEAGPIRWTTRLRVTHCVRATEGGYAVGCAFLRTEILRPWPQAA